MFQPYLLYLKIAGAVVVLALIGYTYYVFSDRTALQAHVASQAVQITMYQESLVRDAKVRGEINEAISKVRITSNNYIKAVDNGKPINVPDGTVVQLIASGLPVQQTGLSTFSSNTSVRGTSIAASR